MATKTIKICGKSFASVQKIRVTLNDGSGTVDYVETSDANATAANIANGKKAYVNGALVTGTHVCATLADMTAAGTATAAQILAGKIAYVKGSKITGTMVDYSGANNAATTIAYDSTGNTVQATVPKAGYYSTTSKITFSKEKLLSLGISNLIDDQLRSMIMEEEKMIDTSEYKNFGSIGAGSDYKNVSSIVNKTCILMINRPGYILNNVLCNDVLKIADSNTKIISYIILKEGCAKFKMPSNAAKVAFLDSSASNAASTLFYK